MSSYVIEFFLIDKYDMWSLKRTFNCNHSIIWATCKSSFSHKALFGFLAYLKFCPKWITTRDPNFSLFAMRSPCWKVWISRKSCEILPKKKEDLTNISDKSKHRYAFDEKSEDQFFYSIPPSLIEIQSPQVHYLHGEEENRKSRRIFQGKIVLRLPRRKTF